MTGTVESIVSEVSKEEIIACGPISDRFEELFTDLVPDFSGLENIPEEDLKLMLSYEIGLMPTEFSINPGESRQVIQFNPNSYNSTMTFSMTEMYDALLARVVSAPKGKKLSAYILGKAALFKVITNRYSAYDKFQRQLMRAEQRKDGITPIPNN
jgi:hypothetical protein